MEFEHGFDVAITTCGISNYDTVLYDSFHESELQIWEENHRFYDMRIFYFILLNCPVPSKGLGAQQVPPLTCPASKSIFKSKAHAVKSRTWHRV